MTRSEVNELSLVYRIEGSENNKSPYMICAHLDVVPEGNTEEWEHDPFLGDIIDEEGEKFVYGRGSLDVKNLAFGILETLEHLAKNDKQPKRTFYVALGHDDEVGGANGAGKIKTKMEQLLESNDETLDFILDEGTFVVKDMFPGVEAPLILISVGEKGWATLDVAVKGKQMHSSIPPKETTVGILAKAITK